MTSNEAKDELIKFREELAEFIKEKAPKGMQIVAGVVVASLKTSLCSWVSFGYKSQVGKLFAYVGKELLEEAQAATDAKTMLTLRGEPHPLKGVPMKVEDFDFQFEEPDKVRFVLYIEAKPNEKESAEGWFWTGSNLVPFLFAPQEGVTSERTGEGKRVEKTWDEAATYSMEEIRQDHFQSPRILELVTELTGIEQPKDSDEVKWHLLPVIPDTPHGATTWENFMSKVPAIKRKQ